MLLEFIPALQKSKIVCLLNKFLYSKYYIFLIGLMTLLCNIFGFEIPYYYAIVCGCVLLPALISPDFLPVIAPLAMTYSSVSLKNNNAAAGTSLFGGKQIHMFIIIGIITISILPRLIYDIATKKDRRVKPALLLGYLFLGPCYIFGGLLTEYWAKNTILYGLVNFLSISACYFILLYAIDWKKVKKDYFFYVMTTYGIAVTLEIIYIVIKVKTGDTSFITDNNHLFTGWGMRNNIAGQIALCVAAPIYLAYKNEKFSFVFLFLSIFMIVGCALSNSRGGLLTAVIFFTVGLIIYLKFGSKKQRISSGIVVGASLLALGAFAAIKHDEFLTLLGRFFDETLDFSDSASFTQGRSFTWIHGLEHFQENEILGVGFFQCKDYMFGNFSTSFVPPRYHNIYIQYLASTGFLGLAAYLFHRYQTLILTFKKPSLEKTFIYLSIGALVVSSFVDNHFFNIGPGLNYCIALAFIEGMCIQEKAAN